MTSTDEKTGGIFAATAVGTIELGIGARTAIKAILFLFQGRRQNAKHGPSAKRGHSNGRMSGMWLHAQGLPRQSTRCILRFNQEASWATNQ